jgi:hypothetical protein
MARSTKVRADESGLYVRTDGRNFRPGEVTGVALADMSDGGLKVGDEVRAAHVATTTRARLTMPDGRILIWHTDYSHARQAEMLRERAEMLSAGIDPAAAINMLLRPADIVRAPCRELDSDAPRPGKR